MIESPPIQSWVVDFYCAFCRLTLISLWGRWLLLNWKMPTLGIQVLKMNWRLYKDIFTTILVYPLVVTPSEKFVLLCMIMWVAADYLIKTTDGGPFCCLKLIKIRFINQQQRLYSWVSNLDRICNYLLDSCILEWSVLMRMTRKTISGDEVPSIY